MLGTITALAASHGLSLHVTDALPREVPWLRRGRRVILRPDRLEAGFDAIADALASHETVAEATAQA